MFNKALSAEELAKSLSSGPKDFVSLADRLLNAGLQGSIDLKWQESGCVARYLELPDDALVLPINRSVFRAILARIAHLCQANTNSESGMTPYGGMGTITFGDSEIAVRVVMKNSSSQQELLLMPYAIGLELA